MLWDHKDKPTTDDVRIVCVYVTVGCPSVSAGLSHRSTVAATRCRFAAKRPRDINRQLQAPCSRRSAATAPQPARCSAASAGSIALTADGGGRTHTRLTKPSSSEYCRRRGTWVWTTCPESFVTQPRPDRKSNQQLVAAPRHRSEGRWARAVRSGVQH